MANKQKTKEEVRQEQVVNQASRIDQFYNDHKNLLWGCVIAVLAVGLGIIVYQRFIYQPKVAEAQAQLRITDKILPDGAAAAAADTVALQTALYGDEDVLGYKNIIGKYGNKAGASVYLSAGEVAFNLGEYDEAISYLKGYNGKEPILASKALSLIGDCYVNKGEVEKGIKYFQDAAGKLDNELAVVYYIKAGNAYEALGKPAEALKCFYFYSLNHF